LREAAAALGAPHWKIIMLVTWRASRAGIITGLLLAVARIGRRDRGPYCSRAQQSILEQQ